MALLYIYEICVNLWINNYYEYFTLGYSPALMTHLFLRHDSRKDRYGRSSFNEVLLDVETLNRKALNAEIDITKISYAAYGTSVTVILCSGQRRAWQGMRPARRGKTRIFDGGPAQQKDRNPRQTDHRIFTITAFRFILHPSSFILS